MTQETGDGASGGPASVERTGGTAAFDAVAAAVEEGVFWLDADGRFEAANDAVVDLVGYDREELLGEEISLLLGEQDAGAVEQTIRELRRDVDGQVGDVGRVDVVDVSIRTASGERIPRELRLAAVEADGGFDGTAGAIRARNDHRREVEAPERERSALDSELDEALDRVSDAFFAVDAEGRFTYVNERAGELLERDPEALVGEDVVEELHGEEDSPFVRHSLDAVEGGEPVSFEEFYPRVSRWFRVRLYPSETGVSVYFDDVTEEKRSESVLEQYERVVEAVDDGLYAVDEDYRFTLVNDAYCRLTGYDREELIGEHISRVVDETTIELAEGRRERLREGENESASVEVEIVRSDGERLTVEVRYTAVRGDEFDGTVGVVRDVSERKAFEETLAALHEASRELHAVETDDDVDLIIMETVTHVLHLSAATLFHYDEGAHEMVPALQTGAPGQELPRLPAGEESLAGHVFDVGEFRAFDDIRETPYVQEPMTEMRGGLFAPIGEDRILVVSSTEPAAFDERTERLVEILAGNATAALERQEREHELRESERRYRSLVDNFPDGAVALYDEECHYVAVGGQMYDRIDLSPEDAVGMTVGERLSGEITEALESSIQRAFEGDSAVDEATYDGRDFRLRSLPIRDDDGDVTLAMVVTQDVTERKERERELEQYETMVETVDDGVYVLDGGRFVFVNEAFADMVGYDREELVGADVSTVTTGEYADVIDEEIRRLEQGEVSVGTVENEIVSASGERVPVEARFSLFPLAEGGRGRVGIVRDVSERKERERELAEQRERYLGLVESAPVPIATYDADGRLTYVNDAAVDLIGADEPDDLVGEPAIEFVHPDERGETVERMRRVLEDREPALPEETTLVGLDGEVRYAIIASAPIAQEGEPGGQVVLSDVTERKEYERALSESEQRYRTLVEHFPNGAVALVDRSLRYQTVGGTPLDTADATVDELEGSPVAEVLPPELADALVPKYEAALRGESTELEAEFDGRVYQFQFVPVRDEEGDVFAVLGMSQETTERRQRERELEESEQRYRTLVESYPRGAVAMFDEDLRYTAAGGQLLEAEDVDPEDRVGQSIFELYPDDLVEEIEPHFRAALEGEASSFEVEHHGRDMFNHTLPVESADGEVFGGMLVVNDVTEQREYERTLERFRTMIETVDDGVYAIDSNGRITMANAAYAEMTGFHREELIGMHASDLVQEEVHERAREIEEELVEGEANTARLTADIETADGETVTAEATFALLPGDDDEYERVAVVRDVTERVEREAELERALDLLHHTEDVACVGGWEIDPESMEIFWTEQLFDLLGVPSEEEPPLEEALDVFHPDDRRVVEEAVEESLDSGDPFDVEVRFVSRDEGETRWARVQGIPEVRDGEVVSLRGAFHDVTERVRRERELRERVEQEDAITRLGTLALEEPDLDRLFERATDLVAETLDNDLCKLLELQPDDDALLLRAGTGWRDGLVGDLVIGAEEDSVAGRTLETEEAIVVDDVEAADPANRPELLTAHGGRSGVSVIVGSQSDPWGVLGTYDTDLKAFSEQDRNFVQSVANILGIAIERASREEELHARVEQQQVVTDLGKRALEDLDLDSLFDEAVERVADTLDNEYAKVLELQPDGESLLLRSGVGWRDGLVGEGTVGTGDDSQAGHTIRSEEPIVVTDLASESRFSGPELLTSHGVASGISTIIGPNDDPWGVLGTHDVERREFSQQDVNFVQSVANILATAIDRRAREREIENQRNRMAAIVRLSEIVQEVDQAVIRQSSREEIDRLVCEHLVESGEYAAAWIGDVNLASERIVPRAVAGVPADLVDEEAFDATGEAGRQSPTATAAAAGETGVARAGADPADSPAIPEFARERGYRSMAAVPLSFEDVRYGVLTLFSIRDYAFEGYERTTMEQLGRTIGHAINAIDRKQALVGDSFTELDIRLPGAVETLDLPGFAAGADHGITVEGTVPTGDGNVVQYFSVTGLPTETFQEAAAEMPSVETVRRIGEDGDTDRFEVTYSEPLISSTLASYGGRIEAMSFDVPDLRVTVALPSSADVRQIVDPLRSEFPDVRIDAQRTMTREKTTTEEYRNAIEDELTERQRTALMTAFFAGYFEWSRDSTGEEVAETLGVSPSTFHQHLRAAQRKVISTLFETDNPV